MFEIPRKPLKTAAACLLAICLLAGLPAAALADSGNQTMPQFEFSNPLVISQVVWMIAIMVVLYVMLARWALPRMDRLLGDRATTIANDLTAAQAAKTAAAQAVAALQAAMNTARAHAQAEIAAAVAEAKARAALEAAAVTARLDDQLAASEAQINSAVAAAMAAIKPVAEQTALTMLARLAGEAPDPSRLAREVELAMATRKAA